MFLGFLCNINFTGVFSNNHHLGVVPEQALERRQQYTTSTAHWRRTPLPSTSSTAGSLGSQKRIQASRKLQSRRPQAVEDSAVLDAVKKVTLSGGVLHSLPYYFVFFSAGNGKASSEEVNATSEEVNADMPLWANYPILKPRGTTRTSWAEIYSNCSCLNGSGLAEDSRLQRIRYDFNHHTRGHHL